MKNNKEMEDGMINLISESIDSLITNLLDQYGDTRLKYYQIDGAIRNYVLHKDISKLSKYLENIDFFEYKKISNEKIK